MEQDLKQFEAINLPPQHAEELEDIGKKAVERQVDYSALGFEKNRQEAFKEELKERVAKKESITDTQLNGMINSDLEALKKKSDKLQELVNMAAIKGPVEASLAAKKIGDPWLEDQFHDLLIKLHGELVKRKKLREE